MDDTQPPTSRLQNTMLDEAAVRTTLIEVLQCVRPDAANVQYRLVGTAAALLRGIALPAGDIDLLFADRQGVEFFAQALATSSTGSSVVTQQQPPIWLPGSRQYFARYVVHGVVVELSTVEFDVDDENDWSECIGRAPWAYFDLVGCGVYFVPTVAVELRLLTELSRERSERYQPILGYLRQAYLRGHPCNVGLVRRGMIAHHVPQELQREVLASIESS